MIVDLTEILEKPKQYRFGLPIEWWESDIPGDQIQGLDKPLEVRITIERIGSRFAVNGSLNTGLLLQCDRCLDIFHQDLTCEFQVYLESVPDDWEPDEEVELLEEEMGVDLIRGEEVELEDIIREQIYLSLPMKILCKEDCQGLCPVCGANRNRQPCCCQVVQGHPAFQKLKALK
ncbi:MAG: hypothetical protein DRG63_06355 [Deltaproteobacteria bacterium]|nr:MAG: hypothetical protein DRG63_06355 [Deltaproteobacteria bacterium]